MKSKNLNKCLELPNIYFTDEEAKELQKNYLNTIKNTFAHIKDVDYEDDLLKMNKKILKTKEYTDQLKELSLKISFEAIIDIYLTKNTGGYPFEDAISDGYLLSNKIFEICNNVKFISQFVFYYKRTFYRQFKHGLINYIAKNEDLSKSVFEDNKLVKNKDLAIDNKNELERNLKDANKDLELALSTLRPKEEKIMKMFFGFNIKEPLSVDEIAKYYKLTRESIYQVIRKSLRKMRHPSRSEKLKEHIINLEI